MSNEAPETVNTLIDIARMLGYAVTVDPFTELNSMELLGSLYGTVYGAVDASCASSHPTKEATEKQLEEWEDSIRSGYIAALRELPSENQETWSAFYYKMLSLQTQRTFTLSLAAKNKPSLGACIALQVATLLFHYQFSELMGNDSTKIVEHLKEASGNLTKTLTEILQGKENKGE